MLAQHYINLPVTEEKVPDLALYLTIDARNHEVIAAEVSLENVADSGVLQTLHEGYREEANPRNESVTALKLGGLSECKSIVVDSISK